MHWLLMLRMPPPPSPNHQFHLHSRLWLIAHPVKSNPRSTTAAYPLLPFIMKEYANGSKTLDKRFFGFWLSSARMVIEHAFGRLKAHFGCLPWIMDIRLGELPVVIHSCCTQWTHPRRFAIDLTSKFHMESLSKWHRFWKANPRGNYDIDSTWKFGHGFDFQNRRNINEFSMWIFRCCLEVEST